MATIDDVLPLYNRGLSFGGIALELGVSKGTVAGIVRRSGLVRARAPQPPRVWTEERLAILRELFAAGDTREEIAAALNTSGEAVRHQCSALGLRFKRPQDARPRRQRSAARRSRPRGPVIPKLPTPIVHEAAPAGAVTFEDLTAEHCRWPYGEEPPFLFCGEPAAWNMVKGRLTRRSYCACHCERASGGFGSYAARVERVAA